MRKDVSYDPAAAADVLARCEYATLALVDAEGPYAVPVSCAFADGALFFHSGRKGRKMDALRRAAAEGTRAAFSAAVDLEKKTGELACRYGYRFRCVFGSGRVRLIAGAEEKKAALNVLMRKYAGRDDLPFDARVLDITEVVAIDVERISVRRKL